MTPTRNTVSAQKKCPRRSGRALLPVSATQRPKDYFMTTTHYATPRQSADPMAVAKALALVVLALAVPQP